MDTTTSVRSELPYTQYLAPLQAGGHHILPTWPAGKGPTRLVDGKMTGFKGWPKANGELPGILQEVQDAGVKHGLMLRLDTALAIDADVDDLELSKAVYGLIPDDWPLRYCKGDSRWAALIGPVAGAAPGSVVLTRGDEKALVEIRCGGNQVLKVAGWNPRCKAEVQWRNLTAELPTVDLEWVSGFLLRVAAKAEELGWTLSGLRQPVAGAYADRDIGEVECPADVRGLLCRYVAEELPNDASVDYARWLGTGAALYHATGGEDDGLEAWRAWSERWPGGQERDLDYVWGSFEGEARSGYQTLVNRWLFEGHLSESVLGQQLGAAITGVGAVTFDPAPSTDAEPQQSAELTLEGLLGEAGIEREGEPEKRTEKLLDEEIWVEGLGEFYNKTTRTSRSKSHVDNTYGQGAFVVPGDGNKYCSASDILVNPYFIRSGARKTVQHLGFLPCGDEIYYETNGVQRTAYYNTWAEPGTEKLIKAVREINMSYVQPYLDVARVHCQDGEAQYERLLDVLAWMAKPEGTALMNFAPVLMGPEGTGKNSLLQIPCFSVGEAYGSSINAADMATDFGSAHLVNKRIVVVDEIHGGKGGQAQINRFKSWITMDGGQIPMLDVNSKGKPQYKTRRCYNLAFTTNHINAIAMSGSDRRFEVYGGPEIPVLKDTLHELRGVILKDPYKKAHIAAWLRRRAQAPGFKERVNPEGRARSSNIKKLMTDVSMPRQVHLVLNGLETDPTLKAIAQGGEVRPMDMSAFLTRAGERGNYLPILMEKLPQHGWSWDSDRQAFVKR